MPFLRNFLAVAQVIFLLTIFITVNAVAQAEKQSPAFTLEVKNNLIDLQAENASSKEILREFEKQTGMKVNVFEGMEDRKVTLNIKGLSIYAVANILRDMGLKNFAGVYDSELAAWTVYMVAEGNSLSEPIKAKVIANRADIKVKKAQIKGRKVLTTKKGKNKVPVQYVKDELMLKFHHGTTQKEIDAVLKKYDLTASASGETLLKIGYIKVRIPDNKDVITVIRELRQEPKLKLPEPNFIANALTISDPLYLSQWYAPDTNFDKAWDKAKSENIIKVAVLDSGIYAGHPDLKGKILEGYDFVNNDADASDDNGHGTFAGGIIAAVANDIGIKGLYDYARIIPVKVIDENGLGTYEDVSKGIIFAADAGAKVINLSIGGYGYSYALQDAVDYALEKGCIVVAAGGNDGIEQEIYPAAYPDVIGVSALGNDGRILPESNRGRHIAVSAPGLDIISTGIDGDYVYTSGTSASAPIVSALAAMLLSERSELKSSTIRRLIMQSAKDLGEKGRDKVYGSGEIDALAALEQKVEPFHDVAVRGVSIGPSVFEKGKQTYITANIENAGTYKSEKVDIVLYEVIGDKKQQVERKDGLTITDTTKVIFEWKPEGQSDSFSFEVAASSADDENNSNDSKITNYQLLLKEGEGLYTLHKVDPPVHQWVAYQAKELWSNSEIKSYLPSAWSNIVSTLDTSRILYGTRMEDDDNSTDACWPLTSCSPCLGWSWDSVSAGYHPYCNHFWNPDSGKEEGLSFGGKQWQSAYRRAQYLYDGKVIPYYSSGDKSAAYYWLGRVAHLLTDMSVPAHVNSVSSAYGDLDVHIISDAYENFMGEKNKDISNDYNFKQWTASGTAKTISSLYDLFYAMAEMADNYESDDANGEYAAHYVGHNGSYDLMYWDVSYDECRVHGNALMPEAIRHVAGLYQIFWNDTHCTYSISPTSQSFTSSAGTGSVTVTPSASSCTWTATESLDWVTITSGSSGTGSGTVNISASANTTGASRTGSITIAGQTFTITQSAQSCTYSISPTSKSFTSSAGTGAVTVTPSASSCAWTATSSLSWVTITSGSSGTGSGSVSYSVSANTSSSSRTGNITIAGQTFTVTQATNTASVTCEATLSADLATIHIPIIKYSNLTGYSYMSADLVYNHSQDSRIRYKRVNENSIAADAYANCQMATISSAGPNNQYTALVIPKMLLGSTNLGGMALDYDSTTGLYTVMAVGF